MKLKLPKQMTDFDKAWKKITSKKKVRVKTKGMVFTLEEWIVDPSGRDISGSKNCALFKNKTHSLTYPALRLMNDLGEGKVVVLQD